jgi:hypothetical protein
LTLRVLAAAMLLSGLATTARADSSDDDTVTAAQDAGVPVEDVRGALNTLHDAGIDVDAHTYLTPTPVVTAGCGWPICGALGQRIYCIEG